MRLGKKIINITAFSLLLFLFLVSVFSMRDDSLIMDEVAHLPAGYSYLTQKDMRLNPEHPPLIKDISAIPLLFIKNIKFPSDIDAWKKDINGQWAFGYYFLYHTGNPVDKIIFWARIPMILILVFFGFFVFKWTKELFGEKAGILAVFLFSFSPTLLAHGRLVTTDIGAATGMFIAAYYFLRALKSPTKRNLILSGVSFGIAELCKFSTIILIPFFAFLGFVWWVIKSGKLLETFKILAVVFIIGLILIWAVYQFHTWHYPPNKQAKDIQFLLNNTPYPQVREILARASKNPILRPFAEYLLGIAMVLQRVSGGNTTYFLGEVSAQSWKNYFPIVYSIKVPLSFHILTIIALLSAALSMKKPFWENTVSRTKDWIKNYFPEFASLVFIAFYWVICIKSNLNIGIRHLLPVFPFTIMLTSGAIKNWLERKTNPSFLSRIKYGIIGILLFWQAISVISVYPHFLAYSNELIGGPDKTYLYTVDSNLDWGQDLKRLKKWVEKNKIKKIYIDYFGGGDPKYYLKDKYMPWHGQKDPTDFPKGNYLAVSATFLQEGRGVPAHGYDQSCSYYKWLDRYKPVAKIGYSIFVYYIN